MAIVKFVTSGCPMNNIFPYVMNREKPDENLISGINCSPDTVLQEFTFVKKQFKKEDGRTYVHIVQAFSPDDDLTPEVAHEIRRIFRRLSSVGRHPQKHRPHPQSYHSQLGEHGNRKEISSERRRDAAGQGVFQQALPGVRSL